MDNSDKGTLCSVKEGFYHNKDCWFMNDPSINCRSQAIVYLDTPINIIEINILVTSRKGNLDIVFYGDNNKILVSAYKVDLLLNTNNWNSVKLEIDENEGKYKAYINGVLLGEGLIQYYNVLIGKIVFTTGKLQTANIFFTI